MRSEGATNVTALSVPNNRTVEERPLKFAGLAGASQAFERTLLQLKRVAPTDHTVLIFGETGTGKELLARAAHDNSQRCGGPFIVIDCGTIPENMAESELFGHDRGAFTGALTSRKGAFASADGGSIYLDEVENLTPRLQAKLLRVLERREFKRLGDNRILGCNFRVIASTNEDLTELTRRGQFRRDLLYRLNGFQITVPPLRERKEDIGLFVDYFIEQTQKLHGDVITKITQRALKCLATYTWPGNIRELKNVIELAMLSAESDYLDVNLFPESRILC